MKRSHLRTLVGHFIESIICDLEQNIWWGSKVMGSVPFCRTLYLLSLLLFVLAQPTKVFRTSHLPTLVENFLESIICDLEQNMWWGSQVMGSVPFCRKNAAKTRQLGIAWTPSLYSTKCREMSPFKFSLF